MAKKKAAGDKEIRIGQGADVHQLVAGRYLCLGGVRVPYHRGLKGHSDADVLLHAVMDALLGAAALGDIGDLFPPSEAKWRGADSRELLTIVLEKIKQEGWRIGNVDCTVLAEAPKLKPHIPAMREGISAILEMPVGACSIKATTTEGLGFVGRREGIMAMVVCCLERENV